MNEFCLAGREKGELGDKMKERDLFGYSKSLFFKDVYLILEHKLWRHVVGSLKALLPLLPLHTYTYIHTDLKQATRYSALPPPPTNNEVGGGIFWGQWVLDLTLCQLTHPTPFPLTPPYLSFLLLSLSLPSSTLDQN